MSSPSLLVIGAGGHAKVGISTARALGYTVAAIYDDDPAKWGKQLMGVPIVGGIQQAIKDFKNFTGAIVAIGDNRTRRQITSCLDGLPWLTLIHPYAWVDPTAQIGAGSLVCAGAVVQAETYIGSHGIINTSASVDHDCVLGDFVHVAPGARLAGGVQVGEGTLLGVGCSVLPNRKIGAWSVIGAGAVVVDDIPEGVIVAGVPARIVREVNHG
ncbi:MAG: acetyltransferase [Armatimonadota bacterium]